jgi:ribosomal-protein-alanine N-acetyltransferase
VPDRVLEAVRLVPSLEDSLRHLFRELTIVGAAIQFHPHPLDDATARRICSYDGQDLYYALIVSGEIVAYGMLRGWDEGYEVPSLGIIVAPAHRRRGYGRALMYFLHAAGRARSARKIRLRVYPQNSEAMNLYQSLGYVFGAREGEQLVGLLDL